LLSYRPTKQRIELRHYTAYDERR